MSAPDFFFEVQARSRSQWRKLEADSSLAAPWWQLFRQVQSPANVVSELLQNAEDAGASEAHVLIRDGIFIFEHNGRDFTADDFSSLCSFGQSNKRFLHSIGFRGIGFKSVFSIGDEVHVHTPSLSFAFQARRFTLPVWLGKEFTEGSTRIEIPIRDEHVLKRLQENLNYWKKHPFALFFLDHISKLVIDGFEIQKKIVGRGPVNDSYQVVMKARRTYSVLIFNSRDEEFPPEALEEIRRERSVFDLEMPPCRVQIILGLPSNQLVYVVLPTNVKVDLPFSCNAPFIQDPGRFVIKDPSISPTNRWLLDRIGRLARESLESWLRNRKLSIQDRSSAYRLLPGKPSRTASTLGTTVTEAICKHFESALQNSAVLLTARGTLVTQEKCIAPPRVAYEVWPIKELGTVFGDAYQEGILSDHVSDEHRKRLKSWG
jgi:hypothetical protein